MADSKVKKIESKRIKAILFDEDGRVLHTFGDAWANWATAEKTPTLGIYFIGLSPERVKEFIESLLQEKDAEIARLKEINQ